MRKLLLIVIAFGFLAPVLRGQIVGPDCFLQGRYVEAGLNPYFGFGTSTSPGTYHSLTAVGTGVPVPGNPLALIYDLGHDGWTVGTPNATGDYVLPGFPSEGWTLEVAGVQSVVAHPGTSATAGLGITGAITGYTNTGGTATAYWNGIAMGGALGIHMETKIDTNASAVVMNVKLRNISGAPLTGVYFMRYCDPDNLSWDGGSSTTNNLIVYQADGLNRSFVNASTTSPYATNFGLAALDSRARAYRLTSLFPSSNASVLYTASLSQPAGSGGSVDAAIAVIFNIGTIAAGDSTELTYAYIFNGIAGFDSVFFPCGVLTGGTVTPDNDTVCGAMSLLLDATGYSTGAGIEYQWQSSPDSATWTDIAGATTVPYTVSSTSATLYYRLVNTCPVNSASAVSAGFRVVYDPVCPCTSVSAGTASASVSTACGTTPVTLNASGYTAAGVTYRWQSSPDSAMWTDIPGATTIPYSFTGISSSTYYRLVVTCAASSTEDFSPGVLITFVACTCPGMTAGTAFASVTSGCSTTPITMSAAGYTVGGVTYRWQASPDSASWTDIPGATAIPYSFTGISSSTYLRLVVTCTASGAEAYSAGVLISFVACTCPALTAGTVTSSAMVACSTTPVTLNAGGYTSSGTTYQWQSSPDGASWTDIAGATSIPYTFTGLSATTHYRLVVTCTVSGAMATSSGVVVTYTSVCGCVPLVAGAISASTTAACSTTVVTLSASGYTSTGTTIRWQASYDSVNWTDLPVTTASYIFTGLGTTTYYRLKVTCIVSGDTVASAGKKITWYLCPPTTMIATHGGTDVQLYPNPATNYLTLETPKGGYSSLAIVNAVGQEVLKQNIIATKTEVTIASLPPGVYHVTLRGEQGSEVRKFVKW